ncbi:hypothetical protein JYU10_00445 [bacterium AH-315-J04]|nr:hypothetical protein [bacterium AH-315-J04]
MQPRITRTTICSVKPAPSVLLALIAFLTISTNAIAQTSNDANSTANDQTTATQDAPVVVPAEQPVPATPAPAPTNAATTNPIDATPTTVRQPQSPQTLYGLWVLAPAIIAIFLAIISRQVVPALVVGLLAGAYLMIPCLPNTNPYVGQNSIVAGFRLACEQYVIGSIISPDDEYGKLKIIIFTLVIGFTVGVLGRNGGTAGMVSVVAGNTTSPRRGALTAWFAGLIVFFDDYANTMIVGPTMRGVFDRLKISRAKLAYIVDSTAAPVASLALIGTWVGAEISFIDNGLKELSANGTPDFLLADGQAMKGMQAFIGSLQYRFYPILALFMVFLVALLGRDFGPMKRAQQQAADGNQDLPYDTQVSSSIDKAEPKWWLGVFPILMLVGSTMAVLWVTGYSGGGKDAITSDMTIWQKIYEVINNADSYLSIFYGAILSAFFAIILTIVAGSCSARDAADAGLDGMARMFPAIVILVLAWSLSQVLDDLKLGHVMTSQLQGMAFPIEWLSLTVFLTAAIISFSTGSSWGTMGILCPATVAIAAGLIQQTANLSTDQALVYFYAAVGSVLAGAVFGDHCSPISDTTVLSSIATGCRHEEHVWTQLPYALVTAIAAMGISDVLCNIYKQPWYIGLGAGAIFLLLVVLIVGRKQKLPPQTPAAPPPSPGPYRASPPTVADLS